MKGSFKSIRGSLKLVRERIKFSSLVMREETLLREASSVSQGGTLSLTSEENAASLSKLITSLSKRILRVKFSAFKTSGE